MRVWDAIKEAWWLFVVIGAILFGIYGPFVTGGLFLDAWLFK